MRYCLFVHEWSHSKEFAYLSEKGDGVHMLIEGIVVDDFVLILL